ncbi:MAG TPA: aspartyl protease family protein [Kofleriaceae bacterium]|nr:aspartyl protease family protein [Kofleriaceae bacterium]
MSAGLTCDLHPEAAARDRCGSCRRTICPVCVVEIRHRTLCRSCADRVSARRGRIRLALLAAGLTASAATLWFLFLRSGGEEKQAAPAADAGPPAEVLAEIAAMRARLAADRCDEEAVWRLGGLENAIGRYNATLALADRWLLECEESFAVRQAQLYALEKTGHWDLAVGVTSALVAEHPTFADYWSWRADAVTGKGELEQAAFDFRQALAIYPNNAVVKFAELARRRGRACEGVFALSRFIDQVSTARAWLHDLRRDLLVEGDCAIRLGRGAGTLAEGTVVRATVGGASGRFLLSERHAHVVVTRAFAARAGLPVAAEPTITILVDGALTTASLAEVKSVEVGPVAADAFEAAVVEAIEPVKRTPIDGVVGLDFLWRFQSVPVAGGVALRPLALAL